MGCRFGTVQRALFGAIAAAGVFTSPPPGSLAPPAVGTCSYCRHRRCPWSGGCLILEVGDGVSHHLPSHEEAGVLGAPVDGVRAEGEDLLLCNLELLLLVGVPLRIQATVRTRENVHVKGRMLRMRRTMTQSCNSDSSQELVLNVLVSSVPYARFRALLMQAGNVGPQSRESKQKGPHRVETNISLCTSAHQAT